MGQMVLLIYVINLQRARLLVKIQAVLAGPLRILTPTTAPGLIQALRSLIMPLCRIAAWQLVIIHLVR
jgi:hypothetical protein